MSCCSHSKREQIVLRLLAVLELLYTTGNSLEVRLDLCLVAISLESLECLNLLNSYGRIVNLKDINRILVVQTVLIHTYNSLRTTVYSCLSTCCCLLDTHLGKACFYSLRHTTKLFNLLYMRPSLLVQFLSQFLDIVRTCPWIDMLAHLGLVLYVNLCITGNTCREVSWQGNSLVQGIGVQ